MTGHKIQSTGCRKRKGFTLIEALVFLFIFSVITFAFYQTWSLGTEHILNAKNRLAATALGNQQMESIRNLAYTDIGTKHWNGSVWQYGIPAGDILQDESITVNQKTFQVHTDVRYIDDSTDGTAAAGTDTIPTDYKVVQIQISWDTGGTGREITLISMFVPDGVEASVADTGVLSINVLDAAGTGVSGATVHITNAGSGIDLTTNTDLLGNVTLPGAPAGGDPYHIVISKSSYYGGQTYPAYPTTTYDPFDLDLSVIATTVNMVTLYMDRASNITVRTIDPFGGAVPNVGFHLEGGRKTGNEHGSVPAVPVYNFSVDATTESGGSKSYTFQSYGAYAFSLSLSGTNYEILSQTPKEAQSGTISVPPGSDVEVSTVLLDRTFSALLVTVTDEGTSLPVEGASVRLSNSTLGYDATVMTDSAGKAYLPTSHTELAAGTYDLGVTMAGYGDFTGTVSISGNGLETAAAALLAN